MFYCDITLIKHIYFRSPPVFVSATETTEQKNTSSSRSSQSLKSFNVVQEVVSKTESKEASTLSRYQPQQYWKLETDSLNILMNQLLEQMDKGPVSMNLVARVKAHTFYNQRPMVKELLESIISAQPASVQKEASKIIQQQSQVKYKK